MMFKNNPGGLTARLASACKMVNGLTTTFVGITIQNFSDSCGLIDHRVHLLVAHIPRDRRPDPHHDPSRRRADETVHRVQRLIRLSLQVIFKPYHLGHDQHPYS